MSITRSTALIPGDITTVWKCSHVLPESFVRNWCGTTTPRYLSRSIDGGKSWSHADPITDRGVWPNACLMANGVIAVTCGRTGDWLAFSLDQGHTWIGHFCFHRGPQAYDACNYDCVEEVAPDTLLVAYARTDINDSGQSEILGTYMEVKRT